MENDAALEKIKLLFGKWKKDYNFKTLVSAANSFGITILFALYNGFLGIRLLSVWHGSICVYYLLLAAIRGIILLTEKRNAAKDEAEKTYRRQKMFIISAVMLFVLNLALILPISLMVILEKPVHMGLIPAIAMAAYTTYKVTMASIHIRKQKHGKHDNVLITELRTINFIDALVSVLTLQNTLIMVNGTQKDADMILLSAVSGAVIYTAILVTTVHLFVKGVQQGKNTG